MPSKYETDLRLAPALSLAVKAETSGLIKGYASTFGGNADLCGDIVTKGAFTRTLAEHRAQGTLPSMLWSHQMENPIGKWLSIEEDSSGLFVTGQINLSTTKGRDAFQHVKDGDVAAFSIGYLVPDGGRQYLGRGEWELKEVDLYEVSLVSVPANSNARITEVKHLSSKSEAVAFLRDAGLSKTAAARFAAGGYSALTTDNLTSIDHQDAIRIAETIEAATRKLRSLS